MRCPSILLLLAIFVSLTLCSSPLMAQSRSKLNRQSQSQSTHGLDKPKTEIKVRMPKDADTPVLVLDSVGGFRVQDPAGFEPTPMLQIFSDGRVLTGRKSNQVSEVEGQMDLVDLQNLLVFISDDSRFFDLTSEMLKSDIDANQMIKMMDAPTTELLVNLKDHSNKVQVYGLPFAAGKFDDVPSVAAMVAIVSRCKKLVATTRLGTEKEAGEAVAGINKALSEKFPNAEEFTLDDLQNAEQFTDGRRSSTFVNNFTADGKTMLAYATRELDSKGKESVNVDVIVKKPRRKRAR